jgi:flagellar motor switch protein FliN/FliY
MLEPSISDAPPIQEELIEELQHFWNIPLNISIQLGVRIIKVREILELKPGSLIELTKPAGGNVDIIVNGSRIALGEVIMVSGAMGVRLTEFNPVE